jgi:hypothetical protein
LAGSAQAKFANARTRALPGHIFRFLRSRVFGTILTGSFDVMEPKESENGKRFFPSGAIFFFALLIAFYAALWLVIYWIMVARA